LRGAEIGIADTEQNSELASRIELQLPKDTGEMAFNSAGGDEERLGDLAVCEAVGRELRDTTFAGCQRLEARENDAPWAGAGGTELGLRVVGQGSCSGTVRGVEGLTQQLARFDSPVSPTEHGAEVGESSRTLQPRIATVEGADCLPEKRSATLTAVHEAGGTQGHAESAPGTEGAGQLELLFGEVARRVVVA